MCRSNSGRVEQHALSPETASSKSYARLLGGEECGLSAARPTSRCFRMRGRTFRCPCRESSSSSEPCYSRRRRLPDRGLSVSIRHSSSVTPSTFSRSRNRNLSINSSAVTRSRSAVTSTTAPLSSVLFVIALTGLEATRPLQGQYVSSGRNGEVSGEILTERLAARLGEEGQVELTLSLFAVTI
jgi:hypothetical protein